METAEDHTSDRGLTEMPTCVTMDEKRQRFISELKEAGYDEALAIRALDVVDPEDVTQGTCGQVYTNLPKIMAKRLNSLH